jgi:NET1-associated nuclear protein 1 (U3 small nucleolar RNA-associated protein 17)
LLQALINISSYFFMAVSNSVKIYSMSTGQIVSTLSGRTTAGEAGSSAGHSDKITALSLDPESPFQLITASLDGTLKVWDFLEATLLKTIQVGLQVTHLCLHTAHPGYAFIACNKPPKKKSKEDGEQAHFPALDTLKLTDAFCSEQIPR